MKDKHLFLIALILAILGLLLLIFIQKDSFKEVKIKEINSLPLESRVKLIGIVNKPYKTKKILIFNLTDSTDTIKVFLSNPKTLNLKENSKIEVSGIVKTYNNNLEIHANSINLK